MRAVETEWWIIELPDEWQAEQDDETILISDEDGVSEIAITTLVKEDGEISDMDLLEYSADVTKQFGAGQSIALADLSGYYFSFVEDGDAVREWYLGCDNLLLLITYSCELENKAMDDSAVDEILGTIFIKKAEPD
ncbi:MAG: hypothetical protein ACJAYG_000442 [Oceanicoccus sp.]|jgi:hypothetical protein